MDHELISSRTTIEKKKDVINNEVKGNFEKEVYLKYLFDKYKSNKTSQLQKKCKSLKSQLNNNRSFDLSENSQAINLNGKPENNVDTSVPFQTNTNGAGSTTPPKWVDYKALVKEEVDRQMFEKEVKRPNFAEIYRDIDAKLKSRQLHKGISNHHEVQQTYTPNRGDEGDTIRKETESSECCTESCCSSCDASNDASNDDIKDVKDFIDAKDKLLLNLTEIQQLDIKSTADLMRAKDCLHRSANTQKRLTDALGRMWRMNMALILKVEKLENNGVVNRSFGNAHEAWRDTSLLNHSNKTHFRLIR